MSVCLSRMWEVLGLQSTVGGASRKGLSATSFMAEINGGWALPRAWALIREDCSHSDLGRL